MRRHRMLGLFVSLSFLAYAWNLNVKVVELTKKLDRLEKATSNYVALDTKNNLELIRMVKEER